MHQAATPNWALESNSRAFSKKEWALHQRSVRNMNHTVTSKFFPKNQFPVQGAEVCIPYSFGAWTISFPVLDIQMWAMMLDLCESSFFCCVLYPFGDY